MLWGIPYLFIKVAVDDGVPPAFLARALLAAVLLLGLAWRSGLLGTVRGKLRWVAAYAVLEISIPFPLIAAGEQDVSSSLAAILIATVPLMIAVLALRFDPAERGRGRRLIGRFIGFAGVVALVGIDVAGKPAELFGAALILVAAAGYSAGPMILTAKLPDTDPRAVPGVALAVAAAVLTPFALLSPPSEAPSAQALGAVVVLGVLWPARGSPPTGGWRPGCRRRLVAQARDGARRPLREARGRPRGSHRAFEGEQRAGRDVPGDEEDAAAWQLRGRLGRRSRRREGAQPEVVQRAFADLARRPLRSPRTCHWVDFALL